MHGALGWPAPASLPARQPGSVSARAASLARPHWLRRLARQFCATLGIRHARAILVGRVTLARPALNVARKPDDYRRAPHYCGLPPHRRLRPDRQHAHRRPRRQERLDRLVCTRISTRPAVRRRPRRPRRLLPDRPGQDRAPQADLLARDQRPDHPLPPRPTASSRSSTTCPSASAGEPGSASSSAASRPSAARSPMRMECRPAFNYARDPPDGPTRPRRRRLHSPGTRRSSSTPAIALRRNGRRHRRRRRRPTSPSRRAGRASFVLRMLDDAKHKGCRSCRRGARTACSNRTVDYWRRWLSKCTYPAAGARWCTARRWR